MLKNVLHIRTTGFAILLTLLIIFKTEWFEDDFLGVKILYIVIGLIGVLIVIPDTVVKVLKGLITRKGKEL